MRFTAITLATLAALFTTPALADWEIWSGDCTNFGETSYPYATTMEPVSCGACGECGNHVEVDGSTDVGETFTSSNPCCLDADCGTESVGALTYVPNGDYHNIYLRDVGQIGYCEYQALHEGACQPGGVYTCAIQSVRICRSDYCN